MCCQRTECAPGDSNPHVRRHGYLKPGRLPVPPGARELGNGSSRRRPATPGSRLRVAVRTEEAQILQPVVEPVPVYVIDDEPQRTTTPLRFASTFGAALADSTGDESAPKQRRLRAKRPLRQNDEDLRWVTAPRRWLAAKVGLAEEMAGVESRPSYSAHEMRVRPAAKWCVDLPQHVSQRHRASDSGGQVFVGIPMAWRMGPVTPVDAPTFEACPPSAARELISFEAQQGQELGHVRGFAAVAAMSARSLMSTGMRTRNTGRPTVSALYRWRCGQPNVTCR